MPGLLLTTLGNALAQTTGTAAALMDDGTACASACCGTTGQPCSSPDAPQLDVTLSWTNTGISSRFYMGQTFSNGQTHSICPGTYVCSNITTGCSTGKNEIWDLNGYIRLGAGTGKVSFPCGVPRTTANWGITISISVEGTGTTKHKDVAGSYSGTGTASNHTTSGVATHAPHPSLGAPFVGQLMGSMVTTEGVTITWAKGSGTWCS